MKILCQIRKIIKNIFLILVNILLVFMFKVLKINNKKVVYLPVEFKFKGNVRSLLKEWIKIDGYKHIYICEKKPHYTDVIFRNVLFCNFGILFIYHYATAKYIIREAGFNSIGLCVRRGVNVIQLWHAAGAFKKFGFDVESNGYFFKLQRARDIRSWGMLLCSSTGIVDIYSKACGDFDKNKIFVSGLPRNDYLYELSRSREVLREKYNVKINQKVILYAPTFRDKSTNYTLFIEFINYLEKQLPNDYLVGIRFHPKIANNIKLNGKFIDLNKCDTEEALVVSDILVTDYSSIIFDFSLLERPMVFYAPDVDDYYDKRGFYYDYTSFIPGPVSGSKCQVLDFIMKSSSLFDKDRILNFKKQFNPYFDGKNSARVLTKILELS